MSIEKFEQFFTPTCDICGKELEAEFDFYDAVDAKKKAGWKSRKDKHGDWIDVCDKCLADQQAREFEELTSACGAGDSESFDLPDEITQGLKGLIK